MVLTTLLTVALVAIVCGAMLDTKAGCLTMAALLLVGGVVATLSLGEVVPLLLSYGASFILVAAAAGVGVGSLFRKKARIEPPPRTPEEAIRQALAQYRAEGSVRTRCVTCTGRITAKRVPSTSGPDPGIELSCSCGTCNGVHPIRSR